MAEKYTIMAHYFLKQQPVQQEKSEEPKENVNMMMSM
jgi:hypothetical protein